MSLDPTLRARLSRFLPADLLDALPEPKALTAAIRRLNSLQQAIASFLPQYIAENEKLYTQHYGDLRPGTFMFADVAGFTALSERLQLHGGREGAEILTEIINQYFGTMLEILAKSNGQLLKFAGDALLTFFPDRPNEEVALFAIRTGLRMQRAMAAHFQPIQHPRLADLFGSDLPELSMSIGISRGKLLEAVVGNAIQRDHIIQGDLPGQAMRAEAAGERDDVIIDAALRAETAGQFETVPAGEGFFRVVDTLGDALGDYEFSVPTRRRGQIAALLDLGEDHLLDDLARQLERVEGVARFVAAEVVNKLAFKGDHIEPENRPATVIFLHFSGFAELLRRWGEGELPRLVALLERYYALMQRTIAQNGGALTRSDPYQQGVKLLITFGAPVAHPDDAERAVTTALEMNRQLDLFNTRLRDELPDALQSGEPFLVQRCGIGCGPVFAGEVGWRARREYTVMGDDVNLAARLMARGEWGQILISERIGQQVSPHFETVALEPLLLKGKRAPTQAYAVRASTRSALSVSPTSDTPFVGRDLLLLSLTFALQQAKGPRRRQAVALIGEAGCGKTRLAKQVAQAALPAGFRAAWADGQFHPHGAQSGVWAALLFQLLQLDQATSPEGQRRLLRVRLQELQIPELEGACAQMIFGRPEPAAPAGISAPPAAPAPVKNIFDLAQAKSDLTQSGIFGMASRKLDTSAEAPENPLWRSVERQTRLPDVVVRFLQHFTEEAPALLVIDDLHLADAQDVEILRQVLAEIIRARLMILVAVEPGASLPVDLRRSFDVADLDRAETTLLAGRCLDAAEIGPRLDDLIWDRTHGRPLFVESLLRLLRDQGQIETVEGRAELGAAAGPDSVPDDVRQLIVSRVDCLPAETRAVLQAASVLGAAFSPDALRALVDLEDAARLDALLDDLRQEQIVAPDPGGAYRFLHGLTRAAVYETLSRMQRQKLHRRAADYWSRQPGAEQPLPLVAHHLVKAGTPLRALELLSGAAADAEQAGDSGRAARLVAAALDIFPQDSSLQAWLARLTG